MGGVKAPLGPREVFGGWAAARGSRSLPFGGGGGEVGGRGRSQGGAKQAAGERPNALLCSVGPGGDPAAHPTPTRPNAQQVVRATQRPQESDPTLGDSWPYRAPVATATIPS